MFGSIHVGKNTGCLVPSMPSDRRELKPYNLPIAGILPHLKKFQLGRVVRDFSI
jgi:hypothetical protein